ncbi:MAG: hypothetical protein M1330_02035 [Armatimonadetes bacterium]|nr:hypothetical protein [Armatimonadota bacterium]
MRNVLRHPLPEEPPKKPVGDNGGVPRERLIEVLKMPKMVANAVKAQRCLLCRAPETGKSGLCRVCRAYLNEVESEAAQAYERDPFG